MPNPAMTDSQRNCCHRWMLVPGGEVGGIMQLGHWVCIKCNLKGPSSRFRCPGLDWTHTDVASCSCTACSEKK